MNDYPGLVKFFSVESTKHVSGRAAVASQAKARKLLKELTNRTRITDLLVLRDLTEKLAVASKVAQKETFNVLMRKTANDLYISELGKLHNRAGEYRAKALENGLKDGYFKRIKLSGNRKNYVRNKRQNKAIVFLQNRIKEKRQLDVWEQACQIFLPRNTKLLQNPDTRQQVMQDLDTIWYGMGEMDDDDDEEDADDDDNTKNTV